MNWCQLDTLACQAQASEVGFLAGVLVAAAFLYILWTL